jgi:phage-related protein
MERSLSMYDVIPYPDQDSALIKDLIDKIKKSGNSKNYIDLKRYTNMLGKYGFKMNDMFKKGSYKRLDENLYELRPTNFRIFFTFKNQTFYLLHGFFKKSQETPMQEIELAKKYIKEIHKK